MKFGEQLKTERNKLSLTQEAVATELFVSRQTISSWETGRTYPDIDSLIALSNLYQISLDRLLKEDNGMVEDIRRKTALRENKLVLWVSYGMVILLSVFFWLSGLKIKGFQIGDYATVFVLLILLGNCFILIFASVKQNKWSIKTPMKKSERQLSQLFIVLIMIGIAIMVISEISWLVPTVKSLVVLVVGGGFLGGLIFVRLVTKFVNQFIVGDSDNH